MFDLEKTEKIIMNLFGLLTAMKSSAENLSRTIDGDTEDIDKHIECVTQLCDISREKLTDVWGNVSDIETETESGFDEKTLSTAEMISHLLTGEGVPERISDALANALTGMENAGADNSPEYISKILSDYGEAQTK